MCVLAFVNLAFRAIKVRFEGVLYHTVWRILCASAERVAEDTGGGDEFYEAGFGLVSRTCLLPICVQTGEKKRKHCHRRKITKKQEGNVARAAVCATFLFLFFIIIIAILGICGSGGMSVTSCKPPSPWAGRLFDRLELRTTGLFEAMR